jgi:hypothetical protein
MTTKLCFPHEDIRLRMLENRRLGRIFGIRRRKL